MKSKSDFTSRSSINKPQMTIFFYLFICHLTKVATRKSKRKLLPLNKLFVLTNDNVSGSKVSTEHWVNSIAFTGYLGQIIKDFAKQLSNG